MPFTDYINTITLGISAAMKQIKELKTDTEYPLYNKKAIKRLESFIDDQHTLIESLTPPFSKAPFSKPR